MESLCGCLPRRGTQAHIEQDANNGTDEQRRGLHCDGVLQTGSIEQHRVAEKGQPITMKSPVAFTSIPLGVPSKVDQLAFEDSLSEKNHPRLVRRASAALVAVRSKLIRHLSTEHNAKRQSRITIGNSEQEVARRAELKRLRQKRIQEELGVLELPDIPSNKSSRSPRHLPSLTSLNQPGGGPRDTIEFVVLEKAQTPQSQSLEASVETTNTPLDSHKTLQQAGTQSEAQSGPCNLNAENCEGESCPVDTGQTQSSSNTMSLHLPDSGSRKSFRLSNSPSWMDRVLGVDNDFVGKIEHTSWDGQSALGIWLIAQGLRSRDNSLVCLEGTNVENTSVPDQNLPERITMDDVDGVTDVSGQPVSQEDTQSASDMTEVAGVRGGSNDLLKNSHYAETSKGDDDGDYHNMETRRRTSIVPQSSSDDLAESYAIAMAFSVPQDTGSSNYNSLMPSFQPSPARSQTNLNKLNLQDLQSLQLSPFNWHGGPSKVQDSGESEGHSSYTTAEDNNSMQDAENGKAQTPDPSSLAAVDTDADVNSVVQSETASFFQRESELQTIQKRFGEVLSRKKPSIPYQSRFKEEFGGHDSPHTSFIPRILLTLPKRSKRSSKTAESAKNRSSCSAEAADKAKGAKESSRRYARRSSYSFGGNLRPLSANVYLRPSGDESATDLWERALRLEAEQREGVALHSEALRPERSKRFLRPGSQLSSLYSRHSAEPSRLTPQAEELPTKSEGSSRWFVPRWKAVMHVDESPVLQDKYELLSKAATPPESWAKYPSHTRNERNEHATTADSVNPRDFAIHTVSTDGQVCWTTDRSLAMHIGSLEARSSSFHEKVGKVVKSGLFKLLPFKDHFVDAKSNALGRRRGSSQLAREVEYPELEALPVDIAFCPQETTVSFGSDDNDMASAAAAVRQQSPSPSVESPPKTPLLKVISRDCEGTPQTNDVFVTPLSRYGIPDTPGQRAMYQFKLAPAKSDLSLPVCKTEPLANKDNNMPRSVTWTGSALLNQPSIRELESIRHDLRGLGQEGNQ